MVSQKMCERKVGYPTKLKQITILLICLLIAMAAIDGCSTQKSQSVGSRKKAPSASAERLIAQKAQAFFQIDDGKPDMKKIAKLKDKGFFDGIKKEFTTQEIADGKFKFIEDVADSPGMVNIYFVSGQKKYKPEITPDIDSIMIGR